MKKKRAYNIKDITGFPRYYVTEEGHIYEKKGNKRLRVYKTTKQVTVRMYEGKKSKKRVHRTINRLVYNAFVVEGIHRGISIINIDGDVYNNKVENLEARTRRGKRLMTTQMVREAVSGATIPDVRVNDPQLVYKTDWGVVALGAVVGVLSTMCIFFIQQY